MLILTRKPGESLYIGDNLKVTIVEIKGNQIRVGIDAPPEYRIYREEIYLQILEENKKAAEAGISGDALEQLSGSWKGAAKAGSGDAKARGSKRVAITGRPGKQIEARATVCERCGGAVTGVGRICSSCGEAAASGGSATLGVAPSNERGKGS
jgi:carbon storage regulator